MQYVLQRSGALPRYRVGEGAVTRPPAAHYSLVQSLYAALQVLAGPATTAHDRSRPFSLLRTAENGDRRRADHTRLAYLLEARS